MISHDWTADRCIERLENGLTVCILPDHGSQLVATALCYAAGSRFELAGEEGGAHFLEHMMFKGSARFGPGEIDRLTQAQGGSNNAFTSHDCALYHFRFASDRWKLALEIEVDRMARLTLDSTEVDSERRVILEELSHAEADPWDVLDCAVRAELYENHGYGRRILGSRKSLEALGVRRLRALHQRLYRPSNAVLVVAGNVDSKDLDEIRSRFRIARGGDHIAGPVEPTPSRPARLRRLERQTGEVARFMAALPGPTAQSEDFAATRLLMLILAGGRCSRLYRDLIDDGKQCSSVMADMSKTVDAGALIFALEVISGVDPRVVEDRFWSVLQATVEVNLTDAEVIRAKRLFLADWVYGFERVENRAVALAQALRFFDPSYLENQKQRILAASVEDVSRVARKYLWPRESGVVGWSLPRTEGSLSSPPGVE